MKKFVALALGSLLIVGCANAPVSHVGVFAKSAEDVADSMLLVLEDVNESGVSQRKSSLAIEDRARIPDGIFEGAFENNEGFQSRVQAVGALRSYSKALSGLAAANFRDDIDDASSELYGSLSGINASIALLGGPAGLIGDTVFKGIATAVDAIGANIAEQKRFQALQEIVASTNPAIQDLTLLVLDDLGGFADEISQNANSMYTDALQAYGEEYASLSYAGRLERLDELDTLSSRVAKASRIVDQLGRSVGQMSKAHEKLTEALQAGKYSTLESVKEIGRLQQEAQRLKTFYDSLETD